MRQHPALFVQVEAAFYDCSQRSRARYAFAFRFLINLLDNFFGQSRRHKRIATGSRPPSPLFCGLLIAVNHN